VVRKVAHLPAEDGLEEEGIGPLEGEEPQDGEEGGGGLRPGHQREGGRGPGERWAGGGSIVELNRVDQRREPNHVTD